jgi:ribonuclease R
MLPPELSEDACSLVQGQERLAAACIMDLDRRGNVVKSRIARCVIVNKRRLTYGNAFKIIQGTLSAEKKLHTLLSDMDALGRLLRRKRMAEGSLDFVIPEIKVSMDADGLPTGIAPYPKNSTNDMIEEFMLIANRTVARTLSRKQPRAVYRIHEKPDREALDEILAFLNQNGVRAPARHGCNVYRSIMRAVQGLPIEQTIHMMLLRSIPKARYAVTNDGHFGLGFRHYTHFTSPIRRYPDLLVHRLLFETGHGNARDLKQQADHASMAEERALKAERDAVGLAACVFFHGKTGRVFGGRVRGFIEAGMFVEIGGTGVDGLVHVSTLDPGRFHLDAAALCLAERKNGNRLHIGDPVTVLLKRVNLALRRIDLELADGDSMTSTKH